MSIRPIRPEVSGDAAPSRKMLDRVIARVNDIGESTNSRPSAGSRAERRGSPTPRGGESLRTPEQLREARSLRRVFDDLGLAYRRYRKETGEPISPVVREAAYRFRKERSVLSLASVAGRLDELKILDW
jgi:hypothetical protein